MTSKTERGPVGKSAMFPQAVGMQIIVLAKVCFITNNVITSFKLDTVNYYIS